MERQVSLVMDYRRIFYHLSGALLGGGLLYFFTGRLVYYPAGWRWLVVLLAGGAWLFRPALGYTLALLGLVLPVAYQSVTLGVLYALAFLLLWILGPFDGLALAGTAACLALPGLASWLMAAPLLAGLQRARRRVGLALLAGLLALWLLLLSGQAHAGLLQTGAPAGQPLVRFQAAPVGSLLDFDWLLVPSPPGSGASGELLVYPGLLAALFRPFFERPLLPAQLALWALTAWLTGALSDALRARPAPAATPNHGPRPGLAGAMPWRAYAPYAAGLFAGALVLSAGSLALPRLLAEAAAAPTLAQVARAVFPPALGLLLLAPLLAGAPAAWEEPPSPQGATRKAPAPPAPGQVEPQPADTWATIAGLADVQAELIEAADSQFNPQARAWLRSAALRPTRGVLLYGPPGTGKTRLARILASQSGVNFIAVSGTEFTSKFYGESEANLRRIFAEARQQAPALLFFDELEAFLPRRSDLSRADAPERGLVATFLAQTDGIADLDGVLLVGATNHPELIDPAALRPGRFDKLIYLSPPGLQARRQILELYLRGQPLAASLDLEQLAARLERFTGADIQALCAAALRSAWGRSQASALQPPAAGSRRGWRWTSAGGSASRQTRPAPPPLEPQDFEKALGGLKPSVTFSMLRAYEALADQYGRRSARPEPVEVVAKPALGWEAVAGLEPVVQALRQAIELPLAHPELLKEYGVKACKGVLLFGPPGCGKTFLAKAAAGAARAHFLSVKGPELLRQAIGQSESLLRELFARARENAPCVLFFDEIDALAEARGSPGAGSTQLLTQLLTELDGFEELRGVMVLAATNRPAALDPALLRPGRFDRLLCVPPPDRPARLALLQKELRGKPLADDVDLPALADLAGQAGAGAYSAADLVALVNAAALEALNAALAETPHERHPVMPITQAILLEQLRLLPPSISAEQLAECESWRARLQR